MFEKVFWTQGALNSFYMLEIYIFFKGFPNSIFKSS